MSSEDVIVEVRGLSKKYKDVQAVDNLSMKVRKGEIFGLLGPNGAGKTTTIRICLDLISKTTGSVSVFGMDAHEKSIEIRRMASYLPGDFGLIPNVKVRTLLRYFLDLNNISSENKMRELAQRLELDINKKTQELSKGNRQKVGIVQALMGEHELLILDEPTAGLDPLIQQEFYKIIREERATGRTVFMSSHVLAEVEAICDRIAIIKKGKLVVEEKISVMQDKMGKILEVEFRDPVDPKRFEISGVSHVEVEGNKVTMIVAENLDHIIKTVANQKIVNMSLKTYSLEQLFLRYYANGGPIENVNNAPQKEESK